MAGRFHAGKLRSFVVMPAYDCMDAEGRAKQEARAEAGIHFKGLQARCDGLHPLFP